MQHDTLQRLDTDFLESPIVCAASKPSQDEIDAAAREIGVPFPTEYQEFLRRYGGAMVGPFPIYGLRPVEVMGDDEWSVVVMTQWFRRDRVPGCDAWAVFSQDHSGNPIGFDEQGVVFIHDHDFGGVAKIAPDFEAYLRNQCLGLDQRG